MYLVVNERLQSKENTCIHKHAYIYNIFKHMYGKKMGVFMYNIKIGFKHGYLILHAQFDKLLIMIFSIWKDPIIIFQKLRFKNANFCYSPSYCQMLTLVLKEYASKCH